MDMREMTEQMEQLYQEKRFTDIKAILAEENPADIAAVLEEFKVRQQIMFFRLLPKE